MPGTIRRFEELPVWQVARALSRAIYAASANARFGRDFALKDQVRRAADSTMSNIAEGFTRHSDREFVRFLFMAKSSAAEIQSRLYLALDLGYLERSDFDRLFQLADDCARQLSGLISYLTKPRHTRGEHD